MASARDISRFGGGPITQSYMHFRSVRKQNLEYLQRCDVKSCKVGPKIGSCRTSNLARTLLLRTTRITRTTVKMLHQRTKVTKTTSIMEPSLIEPTSVTVHRSRHNHGRMDQHKRGIAVGKTTGGNPLKNRRIKEITVSHGGICLKFSTADNFQSSSHCVETHTCCQQ